jgi:1-deoxy-D-xylulose-5-phosphate reductoisomerase
MAGALTKTVTILGSTGSIGRSTVDLLLANPERYRVLALVGNRNAALLAEQALALGAELAVCADETMFAALREALAGSRVRAACGRNAVIEAAHMGADWTMAAITGAAGLAPTLAAVEGGRQIALANKEALVCAGEVMLRAVRDAGATLLPVDSEHNAIFQSLAGSDRAGLEKIILTASGGPFRNATREEMARATPAAALKHPVWSMGAKISIDSATLFNKGLEVIEAARLFDLDEGEIEVLVHPQSVVHGVLPRRQRAGAAWRAGHAHPHRPHAGLAGTPADELAAARSGFGREAGIPAPRRGALPCPAPGTRGVARRRRRRSSAQCRQ